MPERRKEERYVIPDLYRKYINFKLRESSGEYASMELLDYSRYGIKIKTPSRLPVDSIVECSISVPKSLSKEVVITMKIKRCEGDGSAGYLIGAEIIETEDKLWFDLFSRVHDFIKERIGDIF